MINELDQIIFYWVNNDWSNPVFDVVMPFLRNKYVWIPLYTFLVAFFLFNYGKKGYFLVLFAILTVGTADMTSNYGFKKNFKRIRPCNAELTMPVIERVPCGSGYSFTSNHAANHFALATFLVMIFGWKKRKLVILLLLWASSIAIAQVYVGLHYPFDIIGGGLLGAYIGWMYGRLFFRWFGLDEVTQKTV
ncbi:MAG: phosphatase PAP2 family protein [Saprospiraceae bacterium]